ncbi:MAG: hypothetical protein ABFD04_14665 [Syntrophomonas sp.]
MAHQETDLTVFLEQLDYRHLKNMTDHTGMLQFSIGPVPDPRSGYTLDDNARALLVSLNMEKGPERDYLCRIYRGFLEDAWQPEGSWHNLMLDGHYLPAMDSQDSRGRAFLACCCAALDESDNISRWGKLMVRRTLPGMQDMRCPRSMAYVLLGLSRLMLRTEAERSCRELAVKYGEALLSMHRQNSAPGWLWYEDRLTYCNGIMPQSLLAFYRATGDYRALQVGKESLGFLGENLFKKGYLSIVGNQAWWRRGEACSDYDQQPVDACSTALAFAEAYLATGQNAYREKAYTAFRWYGGCNINSLPLYDPVSGGCCDALTPSGLNRNQGAEAVLSLLISTRLINLLELRG